MSFSAEVELKEWMYVDSASTSPKGPLPTSILKKMLEKNLAVSGETMVWKPGMDKWIPMKEVAEFEEITRFQAMQWYFVESNQQQKGPISSRLLLHKLKEGDIDGLTLVFSSNMDSWKPLSEVDILKKEIQRISQEEEAAAAALAAVQAQSADDEALSKQVFIGHEDEDVDLIPEMKQSKTPVPSTPIVVEDWKRSFRADNGIKYIWDEGEGDWVEDENQEDDDDDEDGEEEGNHEGVTGNKNIHGNRSNNHQNKDNNHLKHSIRNLINNKHEVNKIVHSNEGKNSNRTQADHLESQDSHDNGDNNDDEEDEEEGDDGDDNGGSDNENTHESTGPSGSSTVGSEKRKRKRKTRKKAKTGPNLWIYVSGLPSDVTTEEIKSHFSKVGLIAINPIDQLPKIKIYLDPETNTPKGDCSLCYVAEPSVLMALDVLDGGYIRPNHQITVKRADFSSKLFTNDSSSIPSGKGGRGGRSGGDRGAAPTKAQLKVARSAVAQALTWNEEGDTAISKKQGLKIVVLERMFVPADFKNPSFIEELENDIAMECEKFGEIDKITVFSRNPRGIVVVKFKTTFASQECIRVMDGRYFAGRKVRSYYWDGTTNFSMAVSDDVIEEEEKEEAKRIDEFGDWLEQEQEELPEEFQLRVE